MLLCCNLNFLWAEDLRFVVPQQRQGQDHLDIITFYNEIFIPSVKPLLVELGALGTSVRPNLVPEVNHEKDGILLFPLFQLRLNLSIEYVPNIFLFLGSISAMPWIT